MGEYEIYDPGMTPFERYRRRKKKTFRKVRHFVRGPLVAAIIALPILWIGWSVTATSSGGVTQAAPKPKAAKTQPVADSPTTAVAPTTTIVPTDPLLASPVVPAAASIGTPARTTRTHRRTRITRGSAVHPRTRRARRHR